MVICVLALLLYNPCITVTFDVAVFWTGTEDLPYYGLLNSSDVTVDRSRASLSTMYCNDPIEPTCISLPWLSTHPHCSWSTQEPFFLTSLSTQIHPRRGLLPQRSGASGSAHVRGQADPFTLYTSPSGHCGTALQIVNRSINNAQFGYISYIYADRFSNDWLCQRIIKIVLYTLLVIFNSFKCLIF